MNHKSYQTKASRVKGSFKIQMKRPAGNATAKISLYNKKGKYIKSAKYSAYKKKIKIRKKHSIQQQMERNIQEKFQNLMIQSIYLQ